MAFRRKGHIALLVFLLPVSVLSTGGGFSVDRPRMWHVLRQACFSLAEHHDRAICSQSLLMFSFDLSRSFASDTWNGGRRWTWGWSRSRGLTGRKAAFGERRWSRRPG